MSIKFRYMYLRDERRNPIGCLAIRLHRKKGYLEYQVSVVNPVDRISPMTGKNTPFNRNVAKDLAVGRLVTQGLLVPIKDDITMSQVTRAVMSDLASLPSTMPIPARAIKAAKLWLKSNSSNLIVNSKENA